MAAKSIGSLLREANRRHELRILLLLQDRGAQDGERLLLALQLPLEDPAALGIAALLKLWLH